MDALECIQTASHRRTHEQQGWDMMNTSAFGSEQGHPSYKLQIMTQVSARVISTRSVSIIKCCVRYLFARVTSGMYALRHGASVLEFSLPKRVRHRMTSVIKTSRMSRGYGMDHNVSRWKERTKVDEEFFGILHTIWEITFSSYLYSLSF